MNNQTFFHELGHILDKNENIYSRSAEYKKVSGYKKWTSTFKNKNLNASKMPYEFSSIEEHFAVNFSLFMTDLNFANRKPFTASFFENNFGVSKERSGKFFLLDSNLYRILKIDIDKLYAIDYLIADKSDAFESGFGHSMIRLVMCSPLRDSKSSSCRKDHKHHIVMGFRANTFGLKSSKVKGFFGGYKSILFVDTLDSILLEYGEQGRNLLSYELNSSLIDIKSFFNLLLETSWSYYSNYYFAFNNCATETKNLLNQVLSNHLRGEMITTPFGLLEQLKKSEYTKDSPSDVFYSYSTKVQQFYHELFRPKEINIGNATDLLSRMELSQLQIKFSELTNESTCNNQIVRDLSKLSFITRNYIAYENALFEFARRKDVSQNYVEVIGEFGQRMNEAVAYAVPIEDELEGINKILIDFKDDIKVERDKKSAERLTFENEQTNFLKSIIEKRKTCLSNLGG